jgi:hypothetical protein
MRQDRMVFRQREILWVVVADAQTESVDVLRKMTQYSFVIS